MIKRILSIVYSLEVGGLERIVVDLANALDTARYEPYICCIARRGELADEFAYPQNLFVIGHRGRVNVRSCMEIYNLLKTKEIHLVHCHNTAGLFYGFFPAKLRNVPIVHTIHGYVEVNRWQREHDLIEGLLSRNVDRYVCVSEKLKKETMCKYSLQEKKISVLHNGVKITEEVGRVRGDRGSNILMASIGRLAAVKNYGLLLRAFKELLQKYPDCRLELVGEGEEYDDLLKLKEEISLGERVVFKGTINNVRGYLEKIDIFVLPSLSEGISVSILEALSKGKVCVVSDVGGNPEIIQHGVNGFLFESNNLKDLISTLSYVLDCIDSSEMDNIRIQAQRTVLERFSFDRMVEGYCRLYDASIGA